MSLTSNINMTPAELLQLNLNDSALDLLNAAIASHQVKNENEQQQINSSGNVSTDAESNTKTSTPTGKSVFPVTICNKSTYF
jgi:hypothetical protein